MKFKVVFEDSEILVVDKPAGLVVNRSETIKEETLQDQLADYLQLGQELGIGGRAGIVHRLDRETSGLLLVAKTQKAFDWLQKQFKDRKINKEYIGLVHGRIIDYQGSIRSTLGRIGKFGKFGEVKEGREAETEYQVEGWYQFKEHIFDRVLYSSSDSPVFDLKAQTLGAGGESRSLITESSRPFDKTQGSNNRVMFSKVRTVYLKNHAKLYTLVKFFPKTGRTHQIRVHAKSIGHPVVSDLIYTPNKLLKFDLVWCPRLFLHAWGIKFIHPKTKKEVSFSLGLPKDLKNAMLYLTKLPNA